MICTGCKPSGWEIQKLYRALLRAENPLLRGVAFNLKSHMLWRHPFFADEMAVNLHLAPEAGPSER